MKKLTLTLSVLTMVNCLYAKDINIGVVLLYHALDDYFR